MIIENIIPGQYLTFNNKCFSKYQYLTNNLLPFIPDSFMMKTYTETYCYIKQHTLRALLILIPLY